MMFDDDQLADFEEKLRHTLGFAVIILERTYSDAYWVKYMKTLKGDNQAELKTHDELCFWLNKKLKFTAIERVIYDL